MLDKIKAWVMNKYLQSIVRNLGSRVIAALLLIGVEPAVAEAFWSNATAIAIVLGGYLIDQYLSVKTSNKK